jgi:hypothetical protein
MGKVVTCHTLHIPPQAARQFSGTVQAWANRSGYRVEQKGDGILLMRGDGVSSARKCIAVDPDVETNRTMFAYLLTTVGGRKIPVDSTFGANLPARALRKDRDSLLAWVRQRVPSIAVSQSTKPQEKVVSNKQNLWITLLVFVFILAIATLWMVYYLLPRVMQ